MGLATVLAHVLGQGVVLVVELHFSQTYRLHWWQSQCWTAQYYLQAPLPPLSCWTLLRTSLSTAVWSAWATPFMPHVTKRRFASCCSPWTPATWWLAASPGAAT